MVERKTLKKLIKFSCIVQAVNAAIDLFLWQTTGFLVPSWVVSALVVGYSAVLLAYDKM